MFIDGLPKQRVWGLKQNFISYNFLSALCVPESQKSLIFEAEIQLWFHFISAEFI
jgi:hypothetical protein